MRSTCSVHVDVGYLVAACATYVTGSSLRRGVTVDYPTLITRLVERAEEDSGLPLLRVNWYDSGARPGGMPDYQQDEIGQLPGVKLRLGRLSYSGDQKGVDIRIGLDLAIQGQHRVSDVVYLVSGDDDLTEAVEVAQAYGVRVVLLAVPNHAGRPHGVSRHLRREVDSLLVISEETIAATVRSLAIPDGLVPEEAKGEEPPPAVEPAAPEAEGTDPRTVPGSGERPEHAAGSAEAPHEAPASSSPPPTSPSPAVFARRKATELVLPGAGDARVPYDPEAGVTAELVDAVAKQLVASWVTTATPESLVALRQARPTIPGELDRALLVDLSNHAEGALVEDDARHLVRERFWVHVERVRMA